MLWFFVGAVLARILFIKHIFCFVVYVNTMENVTNLTICCRWLPVKTVNVPSTAWFLDYADMGYRNGKLAIVSQVRGIC